MTAVYLHERGFDPSVRFLVVKGETVREAVDSDGNWFACADDVWDASFPNERRERTIPASLPDFEVVCPECKGKRIVWRRTYLTGPPVELSCDRCGASGKVLQVAHAEPQWRHRIGEATSDWTADRPEPEGPVFVLGNATTTERRQAIVAVSDLLREPLVVASAEDVIRFSFTDNGQALALAPTLVEGDTVLALGEPRLLDEPIVEMVCLDAHEPTWEEPEYEDWPLCYEFVPLALLPGLQSVEGVEIR